MDFAAKAILYEGVIIMTINEKASYIKGLADGMKFDTTTDTGRLISEMISLMEDMALSISDLEDENARLEAYIDELDHDLADVEEYVYDDDCCCDDDYCDCDDDDCCCCDDDDCDCCCDDEEDDEE